MTRNAYGWLAASLIALALLPPGALTQAQAATEFTSLPQALESARTSNFGEGGQAMEYIRARIMESQLDPAARNELANALASALQDAKSTYTFKVFACRQLYIIGGEEQVDELLPLLDDPQLAHLARYALEVIPGESVNDALWEAIGRADAAREAGLTASLAARGGASTVLRLAELLTHPHREVVAAALIGLGRIGGPETEALLRKSRAVVPEDLHTEYYEALLSCASRYLETGQSGEAGRLYEELMQPALPLPVRLAGFHGVAETRGEGASPLIAEALTSADDAWVTAALACVRTVGGPKATALFAQQLAAVPPETQVLLIQALADRGDPSALDVIITGADSPDIPVQYAVIDALGALGNETSVFLLLSALTSEDQEAMRRARESLTRMADAGVNAVLIEAFKQGDASVQAALNPILADRQALEALPVLLTSAENLDGDVRTSAFNAIGLLARESDLPNVVALFYKAASEDARSEAARALTQVCRRITPSEARTAVRAGMYAKAPTSLTKGGLLHMFSDLGDDALLPLVVGATADADSIIKDAAIAALAGWPNPTPLQELLTLASGGETESRKKVALDGYIRMLRLPAERPVEGTVAGFRQALALAGDNPDVVRAILAGLSDLKSTEALDIAEGMLPDPVLHLEAAIVAEKIRSKFYTLTASVNASAAALAADNKIETFWQTGDPQAPGQWIEVDLYRPAVIRGIVLDSSRSKETYPRAWSVHVYGAGGQPGAPVAQGAGVEGQTEILFPTPLRGERVRIVLTGTTQQEPWTIHELRILPD